MAADERSQGPPERGGGPTPETANHHHLSTTTRHHSGGAFIIKPRRSRSASWPTIACLDRLCVNCRCGHSRMLTEQELDA
jgi:hypothetical protein